jgi:DNA-binding HxlR family transcriptional regulator
VRIKTKTECPPKSSPCEIGGLLELIARPWTMHILWALGTNGPTRFGSLRRSVDGISSRVLTERLRMLEEKGFVYRHYEPTIPPAVTYGITNRMKDIEKVFAELHKVSKKWQQEDSPRKSAS